jgi:hypothetical protein
MALTAQNEGSTVGDFLVNEWDPRFTRGKYVAEGAVTKGMILKAGTAPATQRTRVVAAGTSAICVCLTDAADGEPIAVLERGPALLKRDGLTYGPSADASNKTATDALLLALGLKVALNIV